MKTAAILVTWLLFGSTLCAQRDHNKSSTLSKKYRLHATKKVPVKFKTVPVRALIAIQIVDPFENKTSSSRTTSKRTIGSSLGYGWQGGGISAPSPPKYQVYKYSQQDIPPVVDDGHHSSHASSPHQTPPIAEYEIQKSIAYRLPTITHYEPSPLAHSQPPLSNFYRPGTTLFSTLDQNGGLATPSNRPPNHLPAMMPVLILRIYPHQLTDPNAMLHAHLPPEHPLAAHINAIDLHGLLVKYVQHLLLQHHKQPIIHPPNMMLQTYENYPRNTHTRVIFRDEPHPNYDYTRPLVLPHPIDPHIGGGTQLVTGGDHRPEQSPPPYAYPDYADYQQHQDDRAVANEVQHGHDDSTANGEQHSHGAPAHYQEDYYDNGHASDYTRQGGDYTYDDYQNAADYQQHVQYRDENAVPQTTQAYGTKIRRHSRKKSKKEDT